MSEGYADSGEIASAEFDSKLVVYWWLHTMLNMAVSFIGIPLVPIWALFGRAVHQRQFRCLAFVLTDRSLNVRRGWLFRKQQNIPLDKITDMSVSEGPLLNALGLCHMTVETAGATPFGMVGVKDALKFRDLVLEQRDLITSAPAVASSTVPADDLLVEIRDILQKILTNLSKTK